MMFELGLVCPESSVTDISEALEALDALSVSVEDADAQSESEQALFGEPGMPPPKEAWQRSKVVALFAKEVTAHDAERLLIVQDFSRTAKALACILWKTKIGSRLPNRNFNPLKSRPTFGSFLLGTNHQHKPNGLFD